MCCARWRCFLASFRRWTTPLTTVINFIRCSLTQNWHWSISLTATVCRTRTSRTISRPQSMFSWNVSEIQLSRSLNCRWTLSIQFDLYYSYHGSWKVPEICLWIFHTLKGPEIWHWCWKNWEKSNVVLKNQVSDEIIYVMYFCKVGVADLPIVSVASMLWTILTVMLK